MREGLDLELGSEAKEETIGLLGNGRVFRGLAPALIAGRLASSVEKNKMALLAIQFKPHFSVAFSPARGTSHPKLAEDANMGKIPNYEYLTVSLNAGEKNIVIVPDMKPRAITETVEADQKRTYEQVGFVFEFMEDLLRKAGETPENWTWTFAGAGRTFGRAATYVALAHAVAKNLFQESSHAEAQPRVLDEGLAMKKEAVTEEEAKELLKLTMADKMQEVVPAIPRLAAISGNDELLFWGDVIADIFFELAKKLSAGRDRQSLVENALPWLLDRLDPAKDGFTPFVKGKAVNALLEIGKVDPDAVREATKSSNNNDIRYV